MLDGRVHFLEGSTVYLRPLMKEDVPFLYQWMNDPSVRHLTGETRPSSLQDIEQSIEAKRPDRVWFAIVRKEDDRIIGETGLLRMFPEWGTTDMSIIIPEEASRGRGYGTETMRLMLTYAFGYMNFNRVAIGVVGFNEKALRFYEKVGFVKEGIQEEGYYCHFTYSDFIMMRILRREFVARHGILPEGAREVKA